jgi:hypothetical protein
MTVVDTAAPVAPAATVAPAPVAPVAPATQTASAPLAAASAPAEQPAVLYSAEVYVAPFRDNVSNAVNVLIEANKSLLARTSELALAYMAAFPAASVGDWTKYMKDAEPSDGSVSTSTLNNNRTYVKNWLNAGHMAGVRHHVGDPSRLTAEQFKAAVVAYAEKNGTAPRPTETRTTRAAQPPAQPAPAQGTIGTSQPAPEPAPAATTQPAPEPAPATTTADPAPVAATGDGAAKADNLRGRVCDLIAMLEADAVTGDGHALAALEAIAERVTVALAAATAPAPATAATAPAVH